MNLSGCRNPTGSLVEHSHFLASWYFNYIRQTLEQDFFQASCGDQSNHPWDSSVKKARRDMSITMGYFKMQKRQATGPHHSCTDAGPQFYLKREQPPASACCLHAAQGRLHAAQGR